MELKWLEDFLSIATTRSFSRSAEARNVTQSAFSRRIRSLELWLGTELLDRATYPVTLTEDGRAFREYAEEIVRLSYQSRTDLDGGNQARPHAAIALTALHTLSVTFVPRWLSDLREKLDHLCSRILPENYALCIQALVDGGYDFLLTFHHPSIPVPLDAVRFPCITVGHDHLVAVTSVDQVDVRDKAGRLPLLQYSRGSFLGLLTSLAQGQPGAPETYIAHVNENSMAEAMKFMALEGHGVAWLPRSLVEAEIDTGRLLVVAPELPMEIRLYRNGARVRAIVEKVWRAATQIYSEKA